MKIFDLHSKRQVRSQREIPEVYQYTEIPHALRVQIVHMWKAGFGEPTQWSKVPELFGEICGVLCREYGLFDLTSKREPAFTKVANFMLETKSVEQVLDVIELTFNFLDRVVRKNPRKYGSIESVDAVITELNTRFLDHGVGYHYKSGQLIRLPPHPVPFNATNPVPEFESFNTFGETNEDYLSAQDHYKHARFAECVSDCLNAFQSTIKAVCAKRRWSYNASATAKDLLHVLYQQGLIPLSLVDHFNGSLSPTNSGLIPLFMQGHFRDLRSTLRARVPTLRNKWRRDGTARQPSEVTEFMAVYALRLAAANIQFLREADRAFDVRESCVTQSVAPSGAFQSQS